MQYDTNEDWLAALRSPDNEPALTTLRTQLAKGLNYALIGRVSEDQLDALIEDTCQEALVRILDHLDDFRGESRFLTWASKIAVRLAFSELRRQRWKDVSLEDMLTNNEGDEVNSIQFSDPGVSLELQIAQRGVIEMVQRLLDEELTERQRQAIAAVMERGMPLEEVARRMGTNRNALYKLIHDARLRLQKSITSKGLSIEDLLATFES